ncbi:MAG TPA: FUSC family protein [Trebonia sp.]
MWSTNATRLASGARLAVPDWLSTVVPDWLAEVMRPKKVPVPWGPMALAVLAVWVPMAVAFGTGRRDLALLPAMGGLLSVMIDAGGPYRPRVQRIGAAAVFGGAPGLLIGTLIHGRGWIAVGAVTFVAAVSSVMARSGAVGSVTGLQLFVYSALGLGALGGLRPWWHTALQFLAGVAWALLLITPGYLIAPRSAERKAVAGVYYALARGLRLLGTPGAAGARTALAAALNAAYDAMLTGRAAASGRSGRDIHLLAVLNVSHQFAEAAAALRVSGERVPPLVTDDIERLADAIADPHGAGSGALGLGGRPPAAAVRPPLPFVPPAWSASPGALALREAMVSLVRVLSGSWTPPAAPPLPDNAPGPLARVRARARRGAEQLLGGRIAWEFTVRLTVCTGIAAILSEVLPLQRSYWMVLTVGIILKPDYGSVFARAVQRGIGTVVGAVLGAVILAVVPYGPWLLLPFGVLAALLPYGKARNFGLAATFLTPFVVLLIDLLDVGGWHLAEARLVDTVLGALVVLVVGYAPWPSAWQAHLPPQFAEAVRAVCAYADEALVATPAARIAATGTTRPPGRAPGEAPGERSRLRRRTYRALSNLRAEFQRTMSEPTPVSRRAAAWWPAVVALEEVMDAVTATVVAIGRGAPVPSASAVHALTGTLRAVADAIEAETVPRTPAPLPGDPALEAVTAAVRSVLSVLIKSGDDAVPASPAHGAPAPV